MNATDEFTAWNHAEISPSISVDATVYSNHDVTNCDLYLNDGYFIVCTSATNNITYSNPIIYVLDGYITEVHYLTTTTTTTTTTSTTTTSTTTTSTTTTTTTTISAYTINWSCGPTGMGTFMIFVNDTPTVTEYSPNSGSFQIDPGDEVYVQMGSGNFTHAYVNFNAQCTNVSCSDGPGCTATSSPCTPTGNITIQGSASDL